ncbi:MAG: SDR family oxidoreductase [Variovorax sp.]|nr:MAG: SDR family oxidoreductase [Variovorax sp.]
MKSQSKTIVITGASSGIGLALAGAYLQRGDNVVANARNAERLQQAAESLGSPDNFLTVAGDVADPATGVALIQRAVERFGQVDVLINNAGIFNAKPFVEYTPDELEAMVNTNLKGFFYPSQAAARHMIERKAGHIINITASIALQPNQSVPAVLPVLLKGGINQATKALALELAPHNVQVAAVAPGIVDTPMYTKDMHGFLNSLQPAGRIATTQEIVDAVLYLGDASFTTGIVLPVDGGMSSGKW